MKINRKILLTCVFAATIVVGFGLGKVKNAQASTCECGRMGLGSTYYTKIDDQTTKENCKSACETKYGSGQVWSVSFDGQEYTTDTLNSDKSKKNDLVATGNTTDSLCNMSFTKYFSLDVLKCLLLYILKFIGTAIQAATTLFIWVIDTDNMKAVINNSIIYDMWKFVRDMLNVAFILVLLFSAFCTVFQITKYGYKNILLTLIIMALLVNFSFPIARIIIDFSNVIMYFLINGLASDAGLTSTSKSFFVQIANNGGLAQLVKPGSGSAANMGSDLSFLIAAVVFTFIFMVTLVIIAVLLLIRLIVLAVLMIFASVAFVGSIVPFLSKYSSDWWDTLFKQAFFGPVMVFMMVVAFKMMTKLSSYQGKMQNIAAAQSSSEIGNFIAAMAFFSIPIVILWVGIGSAQKMSVVGAGAVVGRGTKFMGWAGRTFSGYRAASWTGKKVKGAAKYGAKAGLRKFDRDVLGRWSPRAFVKAWEENFQKIEEEKMRPAAGAWRDRLNKMWIFGGKNTRYEQLELDRLKTKEEKEYKEMSEDSKFVNDNIAKNIGKDTNEARAKLKALFTMHFNQNDQDELMDFIRENLDTEGLLANGKTFRQLGFKHDIMKNERSGATLYDDNGNVMYDTNTTVSAENVVNAVEKIMSNSGTNTEETNKLLLDLSMIAAAKGGIGYGSIKYNEKTRTFERTNLEEGELAQANASKIMTTGEAQNIPKTLHRNHFTDQSGNLNQTGMELLRTYASPTAIKHIERHKPDFYTRVGADNNITKQMYNFAKNLRTGNAMLYDRNTGKKEKKQDETQAKQAVAWIAALQSKSPGITTDQIKKSVTDAGFEWSEINTILSNAGVKLDQK